VRLTFGWVGLDVMAISTLMVHGSGMDEKT